MKLWIDAQLSSMLAKWITENFATIEAIAVRDLSLRDAEDQVIFFSAREADATVMTRDSDFLEMQKKTRCATENYLGHLWKYFKYKVERDSCGKFATSM